MNQYRCKNFIIQELVPEDIYIAVMLLPLHEEAKLNMLWGMFDPEALKGLDWLKETYSPDHPVIINTWWWCGGRGHSGLRDTNSRYYREGSMHSIGCAFDLLFENITAQEIRDDLTERKYVPYITRVEGGVSWIHMDTKPTNMPEGLVYVFNP